ncbi:dihydrodipicolinate synthase family protein [Granulicella sp. dw_53]|uniref:dihydrodipicolinate synthase family protein n=1 Tax=Granulicella sp. dw_53 TaxID=2719792 RepID=UPI001BD4DB4F|nr:dihydrodipicolinate synthase family protein [Granulicella sp. dw_53]
MLLEGLFLPLTTPFYLDGRLNLRKMEHNVDRYSKTPVTGLAVLSEYGDPTLLTEEETREALRSAMEAAAATKVMLAGISRDSVAGTVELAVYAASLGYDAALVGVPTILRRGPRVKEVLAYFQSVADQSPLPLVLVSSVAGTLATEAVIELAAHPNILGLVDGDVGRVGQIKSATASVKRDVTVTTVFAAVTNRMLALRDAIGGTFISADTLTDGATALAVAPPKASLRTRTKTVGFQILTGGTVRMLEGLKAGAVGVMPPFSASAPQGCYEVLAAWKDGDMPLAEEKQFRVQPAAARIEGELGSAGIRYGCDLNGYFGGRPRLPLLPVSGEERAEIELLLRAIRN